MPNILRDKGNQTMKLGQLKIFFLKNHTHNKVETLVPDPFI